MAKKIEGYVTSVRAKRLLGEDEYSVYGDIFFFGDGGDYDVPVTVTVHEGKPERVFTESEVRQFISALKDETLSKSVDHWIDHVARTILSID